MAKEIQVTGSFYDGFFSGGARKLHTEVVIGLHRRGQPQTVFSIHDQVRRENMTQSMQNDACYKSLRAVGIPVTSLGRHITTGQPFTRDELAASQEFADATDSILSLKEQPLTLLNKIDTGGKPVTACLHRSDPGHQGPAFDALMEAIDSGKLTGVICCAKSTREAYRDAGVPEPLLYVITNGIDLERFTPSPEKGASTRRQLAIPEDVPVVIFSSRYDGMKNVPLFLEAANIYLREEQSAHIIMCGAGMNSENSALQEDMAKAFTFGTDFSKRLHVLGIRQDMDALYNAANIVTLTSAFGEAFPLSLVEGMACGAVPVATDVGDCREILNNRGIIVEPDADSVALAWQEAYELRDILVPTILAARKEFDRETMIDAYSRTLQSFLESPSAGKISNYTQTSQDSASA